MVLVIGALLLVAGLVSPGERTSMFAGGSAAFAAPAAAELSDLAFSEDVDDRARPHDPKIEFDSSTEDVWVSFEYRDYHGDKVSFLARANGEDWSWGDLDCCDGSEGRYAFPLKRRSGKDLGGAAYDVYVYVGDAEKAHGGFGVRGTRGFDSNGDGDDNGNDND